MYITLKRKKYLTLKSIIELQSVRSKKRLPAYFWFILNLYKLVNILELNINLVFVENFQILQCLFLQILLTKEIISH